MRRFLIFVAILTLPASAIAQKTILHCGKFIDGRSDEARLQVSVVISEGKITDVRDGYLEGGEEETVIDLRDKTVLPGLMDMHTHLSGQLSEKSYTERFYMDPEDYAYRSVPFARKTLMAGFTTVPRSVASSAPRCGMPSIKVTWWGHGSSAPVSPSPRLAVTPIRPAV